jgi:inhibitor of cysteine peptidase
LVQLTEADGGRTIELTGGDSVVIALQGNPTTGYLWEMLSGDKTILRPVGEPRFRRESSAIGAGGTFSMRFEAVAAGRAVLRLGYRRPFERDIPPIRTFQLTVIVR